MVRVCFGRWDWCCLYLHCIKRRLWTWSRLLSALPTTTCISCTLSPWLICCRSSSLLQVQRKPQPYSRSSTQIFTFSWTTVLHIIYYKDDNDNQIMMLFLHRFSCCGRWRGDGWGESSSRTVHYSVTAHWKVSHPPVTFLLKSVSWIFWIWHLWFKKKKEISELTILVAEFHFSCC